MGNRMTVARPYIIDDYATDDDDDDDDYINYETAYDTEGADQNFDEEDGDKGWSKDSAGDNADSGLGQQVTVNSQVVSSLVKEVETLLNYLDKEDYEGAQKAARILKEGGGGEGERGGRLAARDDDGVVDESKPLLSKTESQSIELVRHKQQDGRDVISRNGHGEEVVPLMSEHQDVSNLNEDWTTTQRKVLQQLDRDLTSFEENESRVVSDNAEDANAKEVQPRRRRKSSLPRLKRGAFLNNNEEGGGSVTVAGGSRSQSRSRESSLNRSSANPRLPRSPASCIPRFCYKVSSTKSASSISSAGSAKGGSSVPASNSSIVAGEGKKPVDEAITRCVKGFTSQAIPDTNENFRGNPISYTYRMAQSQSSEDNEEGMYENKRMPQTMDVNISDFSGRARRNKKRSGIPSLWTQNKTHQSPVSSPSPSVSSANTTDSLNLSPSLETVKAIGVDSATQTIESGPSLVSDISVTAATDTPVQRWEMNQRKVFDQRRWNCISRPQYKTSCGMSSVVSCWNFLFSTLGHGQLQPVSQEEAMALLGYKAPFDKISFGPTTGNLTLLRWFRQLNIHFKVNGQCYIMYKPRGRNQTGGMTSEMALEKLKSGLRNQNAAFIYHCHNHYFCPIGFEESPSCPTEAYSDKISEESTDKSWILIGDTSKKYGPFHCKSWEEIVLDLNCENPEYLNIRQTWNGVMKRKKDRRGIGAGGNLHCIMCFQSPQLTQNDHNQHNKSGIILQEPFHLHPPPPPSSLNSSQDGDDGSGDCNDKEGAMTSSDNGFLYAFDYRVGGVDAEEEEEEIISNSSEDEDDDDISDISNCDADSLS